jgi:hypothetical protein
MPRRLAPASRIQGLAEWRGCKVRAGIGGALSCGHGKSQGRYALHGSEICHQSTVTKFLRNRMSLAETYRGGLLITTVILICGYSTPRILRWVAKGLAKIAD